MRKDTEMGLPPPAALATVNDVPPPALADLLVALRDEDSARAALRDALHRQAVALWELRRAGMVTSTIAAKVAKARGETLDLRHRLKLAERLRKRAWRGTHRPVDHAVADGQSPIRTPPSDRAMVPINEEQIMPKLVKKTTVTEEYVEPDDNDEIEDAEADVEDEAEESEEEPAPTRRRR